MGSIRLAVAGTDGSDAKLFLEKLEDREDLEITSLFPLETAPEEYDALRFRKKNWLKEKIEDFDFSQTDVAVFYSAPSRSRDAILSALEAGCAVIDATGGPVPQGGILMIPAAGGSPADTRGRLFVSPPPPVISSVLALGPVIRRFGLERAEITAMESASASGYGAVMELAGQTAGLLNGRSVTHRHFPVQSAFNVIPSVIGTSPDGEDRQYSDHELAVIAGLESFLPELAGKTSCSCFTVPMFHGYCAHISFTPAVPVSLEELRAALEEEPSLEYVAAETVSPVTHGTDRERQVITRLRSSAGCSGEFNMFAVMDSTMAGMVLNSLGILEWISRELF